MMWLRTHQSRVPLLQHLHRIQALVEPEHGLRDYMSIQRFFHTIGKRRAPAASHRVTPGNHNNNYGAVDFDSIQNRNVLETLFKSQDVMDSSNIYNQIYSQLDENQLQELFQSIDKQETEPHAADDVITTNGNNRNGEMNSNLRKAELEHFLKSLDAHTTTELIPEPIDNTQMIPEPIDNTQLILGHMKNKRSKNDGLKYDSQLNGDYIHAYDDSYSKLNSFKSILDYYNTVDAANNRITDTVNTVLAQIHNSNTDTVPGTQSINKRAKYRVQLNSKPRKIKSIQDIIGSHHKWKRLKYLSQRRYSGQKRNYASSGKVRLSMYDDIEGPHY